ncbi:MAG: helix-turn-helix transcriptional regulator [Ruthenibacterium lactatiformans]
MPKTIVKTVIKFLNRAPAEKGLDKPEGNTIDFPNMTPLKVSRQPSAAGLGVYLGRNHLRIHGAGQRIDPPHSLRVPVSGDSMEPKFHDGDIALVNFEPAERETLLLTMDGLGYKKLGDGVLISLNKKYKPIPMKEDIRVNGKVIGILDPEWF